MSEAGAARASGLLAAVLAAGLLPGCLVQIDHCTNAEAAFREARAEAAKAAGRSGNAGQVNVLVFDPDDEKLVRIRVPMWLAKKVYHVAEGHEDEIDLDADDRDLAGQLSRRVRLEDLEKAGPGLLLEVDETGGEQVLVWLR
jgi:hypothetical protein